MARPAAACLLLAALSLLGPSEPSYDPWAWLVWGREIGHLTLDTTGGPSWKPLPVALTTLFSPLSALDDRIPPALWVVVARAGALLALVLAFRLAGRLAGGPRVRRGAAGAVAVARARPDAGLDPLRDPRQRGPAGGGAGPARGRAASRRPEARRPRVRCPGVPPAAGAVRVPAPLLRLHVPSLAAEPLAGRGRAGRDRRGLARAVVVGLGGSVLAPSPRLAASPRGACR